MPLLLLAITSPPSSAVGLPISLEEQGLVAWVTEQSGADAEPGRAELLDHHRAVSLIFDRVEACLPARFGTRIADPEALRAYLRANESDLTRRLERVRGRCELAVTALWTEPPPEDVAIEGLTPGRRYLIGRQTAMAASDRRRARAQAVAKEIEESIRAEVVAAERRICPSAAIAFSIALLLQRGHAHEIMARLGAAHVEDVRILVNGVWPPYTFAGVKIGRSNGRRTRGAQA